MKLAVPTENRDLNELPPEFVEYVARTYYQHDDPAHGMSHINQVRVEAKQIATSIGYKELRLVDAAALLHDIARHTHSETHEEVGAKLLAQDPQVRALFNKREIQQLVHAVAEHRASTGKPKTELAKILSDADRLGATNYLRRAYEYHVEHSDDPDELSVIVAIIHIATKFSFGGRGTRTYYPHTAEQIRRRVAPAERLYKQLLVIVAEAKEEIGSQ
jgi:hypothetical protein